MRCGGQIKAWRHEAAVRAPWRRERRERWNNAQGSRDSRRLTLRQRSGSNRGSFWRRARREPRDESGPVGLKTGKPRMIAVLGVDGGMARRRQAAFLSSSACPAGERLEDGVVSPMDTV